MTSRERLLAVLSGQLPDRVPISCYELNPFMPDSWEGSQPSFAPLLNAIGEHTDCLYMLGLPQRDAYLEQHTQVEQWREGGSLFTRTRLQTPRGELGALTRQDEGVNTVWCLEHLLETREDMEKYLSIPFDPLPCDPAPIAVARERVGDHGIVMMDGGDAAGTVAGRFPFAAFTEYAFTERGLFTKLVEQQQELLLWHYRDQLSKGAGPLYRLCGAEYFTPPYLPPSLFEAYVYRYLAPIIDLMHGYGVKVRVHSHGRVGKVLPMIVDMGADALDPIEPPPDGDIELAELKRLYGGRLCLFGNIELRDLEYASPERMRSIVRETLRAGMPGGGFVLMPSASPIQAPLASATLTNYRIMIETALEEGQYA